MTGKVRKAHGEVYMYPQWMIIFFPILQYSIILMAFAYLHAFMYLLPRSFSQEQKLIDSFYLLKALKGSHVQEG